VFLKYNIFDETVTSLTISVTTIDGDPDLYVSKSIQFPDKDSADIYSEDYLSDTIVITKGTFDDLVGEYHIAVRTTESYSYFTIVAIEEFSGRDSTIKLYPGVT
jgi:hypothetical protein